MASRYGGDPFGARGIVQTPVLGRVAQVRGAFRNQQRLAEIMAVRGNPMPEGDDDSDDDSMDPNNPFAMLPAMAATPASNTTPQELVKLDPAEIGMSVGYKHLYSGKEDKRGRFQWQKTIPEDVGKPAEDAESEKWAIVVRHVKTYSDSSSVKVLEIHSILIQSPLLKELLKEVLAEYPGVTVGLKRLEFKGRFEPLIHRWAELNEAIERLKREKDSEDADEQAATRLEHAELLRDLLAEELKETIETSSDLKKEGDMSYEHLWTLFQPGTLVYSKQEGQDRIFKLHLSRYGQDHNRNPVYWVTCQYVDYDGSRWGTKKLDLKIPAYEGTRPIKSLFILPLDFHADKEGLMAKLIERAEKIQSLAGSHYRAYNGVGWFTNHQGQKEMQSVKGRVVIDTQGWNRFNPNDYVHVSPFHLKDVPGPPPMPGHPHLKPYMMNYIAEDVFDGTYDACGDMPVDGSFADKDEEEAKRISLSDEQKLMCTPLVRGYALKEKSWLNLFGNAVQDISFNEGAFDSLVLPENQKELILGFTSTQHGYRNNFDDVIEGKGRGIILLLCGPPGVGKTLTAESVAEEMKVPLFALASGDLGIDPTSVEVKLQGVLDMCSRWNAVILLDEADVFLEARSRHELERNKLVSIFLRLLEYYEGIMFLTTNRVETFDPAFHSRIHISLKYPELDAKSRKTVWQNFLIQHNTVQAAARERPIKPRATATRVNGTPVKVNGAIGKTNGTADTPTFTEDDTLKVQQATELHFKRTMPHTITPKELTKLCGMTINGRQIKNILKTAQLLASQRGEGLSYTHISSVMDVTQHLHNTTLESERAKASIFT